MRKAFGGGMKAAAAVMLHNTMTPQKLQSSAQPFEWQLNLQIDRPRRGHLGLIQSHDAQSPTTLLLKLSEHSTPELHLTRDILRATLRLSGNATRASPREMEELAKVADVIHKSVLKDDAICQVLLLRLLFRKRAIAIAAPYVLSTPPDWITPVVWYELVDCMCDGGQTHHSGLIQLLIDTSRFPVAKISDACKSPIEAMLRKDDADRTLCTELVANAMIPIPPSGSSDLVLKNASYPSGSSIRYGLTDGQAAQLILLLRTSPITGLRLIERYVETCAQIAAPLHPTPFLAFFKSVFDSRDYDTRIPMVHWKIILQQFQKLNKSCPMWYRDHPEEAGDVVKYVIMTLSSGANPFLTLNIARVAASKHVLDGVELSLWFINRMSLAHHVEETREVASRIVHWLFHVIGIHLQEKFHQHIIPLARALLNLDSYSLVAAVYNIVIDHVSLFSVEFRRRWMQTMNDLICSACGTMFHEKDVFEERTCRVCMHVTPPKDEGEVASFEIAAEHLEWLRQKRKATARETKKRVQDFVRQARATPSPLVQPTTPPSRPQKDAAEVFRKQILQSSPSLQIGSDGGDLPSLVLDPNAAAVDVRSAVEEAHRRSELLETLRRRQSEPKQAAAAALPGTVRNIEKSTESQFRRARERAVANQTVKLDAAWRCVWCQEENPAGGASRACCEACGAETGPEAPWRTFASEKSGDIIHEIRLRITSNEPSDTLIAAYNMMIFRRSFLFSASESDARLVEVLIDKLAKQQERVLAGYLFMRLVPSARRPQSIELMLLLARLFGNSMSFEKRLRDLRWNVDQEVFDAIFDARRTCKVCFGDHSWESCPIVTRDFSKSKPSLKLSTQEKYLLQFKMLKAAVDAAVAKTIGENFLTTGLQRDKKEAEVTQEMRDSVLHAYTVFLTSSMREAFCHAMPMEANKLSRSLAFIREFVRASFVLCHIPLYLRYTSSYLAVASYFDVSEDDCSQLLRKRSAPGTLDETHPNFSQVTRTCCVCLKDKHASFACPLFHSWMQGVMKHYKVDGDCALVSAPQAAEGLRLLKAQVDGWIRSGPERLHAFYRFLLEHIEELILTKIDAERNPVFYALNETIKRLADLKKNANALRLYSKLPEAFALSETTKTIFELLEFDASAVEKMMLTPQQSRESLFERDEFCLCCFERGHGFTACPEIVTHATHPAKTKAVIDTIGTIRTGKVGIRAAANYVYREYNYARFSPTMLRSHVDLVKSLISLVHRCFATKSLIPQGVRLFRRIPLVLLEFSEYDAMWKATGVEEKERLARMVELEKLFAANGIVPRLQPLVETPKLTAEFMHSVAALIHKDQCRHCHMYGHEIVACEIFHEECAFARDLVATFRVTTMLPQLYDNERMGIAAYIVKFLCEHQLALPFHVLGTHQAMNSLAATLAIEHEPALAMKLLLALPPAYRKRHPIHYIMVELGMDKLDIIRTLTKFLTPADGQVKGSTHRGEAYAQGTERNDALEAWHMLTVRPPIPCLLVEEIFSMIPGALTQLNAAERRADELIAGTLVPRPTNVPTAEKELMKINSDLNLVEECAKVMKSTPSAAKSLQGNGNVAPSTFRLRQSCDMTSTRESFLPLILLIEKLTATSIGSRHEMLLHSQIEAADVDEVESQDVQAIERSNVTDSVTPETITVLPSHDPPSSGLAGQPLPKTAVENFSAPLQQGQGSQGLSNKHQAQSEQQQQQGGHYRHQGTQQQQGGQYRHQGTQQQGGQYRHQGTQQQQGGQYRHQGTQQQGGQYRHQGTQQQGGQYRNQGAQHPREQFGQHAGEHRGGPQHMPVEKPSVFTERPPRHPNRTQGYQNSKYQQHSRHESHHDQRLGSPQHREHNQSQTPGK